MNEENYKLWDKSIKFYAKKSGKTIEEVQKMIPYNDMEVATDIRGLIKKIHFKIIYSTQTKAQILNTIAEFIRPFPKDDKIAILTEVMQKIDETEDYDKEE